MRRQATGSIATVRLRYSVVEVSSEEKLRWASSRTSRSAWPIGLVCSGDSSSVQEWPHLVRHCYTVHIRGVRRSNGACPQFLADRTNGRAYATLLRPSVVVCRL